MPVALPPQKNMLMFVISIIMIIFGAIALLLVIWLLNVAGANRVTSAAWATIVLGFISVLLFFGAGIVGVRWAAQPQKGQTLFVIGIAMIAIGVIGLIMNIASSSVSVSSFSGFVIPGLYTLGAYQLKTQAAQSFRPPLS